MEFGAFPNPRPKDRLATRHPPLISVIRHPSRCRKKNGNNNRHGSYLKSVFRTFFVLSFYVLWIMNAVCSLQSAVCSLRSAVCGLQSAVCICPTPFAWWLRSGWQVGGSTENGMASQNSRNCLIWAQEYLRVAFQIFLPSFFVTENRTMTTCPSWFVLTVLQTRGRVSFFSRKGVVLRNRVCLFVLIVVLRNCADSCRAEPRGLGSFRHCATARSGNRRIWRIRLSTTPI